MNKRVVITGIGMLSPLGNSPKQYFNNALRGQSAVSRIKKFDPTPYVVQIGAELLDEVKVQKDLEEMSTVAKWCLSAGEHALNDAGIVIQRESLAPIDVVLGVSISSLESLYPQFGILSNEFSKIRPATPILMNPAAAAIQVSRYLGLSGEIVNITTACSSTASAIGYATRLIQCGDSTCILTGGAEESISPLFLGAFGNGKCLSRRNSDPSRASRPFDRQRDGYVLGDAACVLILEEYEHAKARGAQIYCEVRGYAGASDSSSAMKISKSDDAGVRAIEKALTGAQRTPSEIDYYCAIGASDPWMDIRETNTIKRVFREEAKHLCVSSIKSMIGHPMGASGAMQAATSALSIKNSRIPPTINYEDPDPECDLDYVPNVAREKKVRNALVYTIGNTSNTAFVLSAC